MAQGAMSLKSGWLPVRNGRFYRRSAWLAAALSIAAFAAAPARPATILFAGGNWAAIDFGKRCEARSKGLWARKGTTPFAGFAFDPAGRLQGRFYVHLNRPARAGSSVIATIGSQPFLLGGSGQWAWSTSAAQRDAILEAARFGSSMRVESRGRDGRRIVDRYTLAGAATAIDSAAAACAGKMLPQ